MNAEPNPAARLVHAIEQARAAAIEEAAADMGRASAETAVGEHLDSTVEDPGTLTHFFAATQGGYRGWRWSVTLAAPDDDGPVTVCEVVLLPGPDAVVAPVWVPWNERIRPGDLGVGDLLPAGEDDERLVPGYLASDDPAVEEVAFEIGLGRTKVLSRAGRESAAERWFDGPHGPGADMARAAPGSCGTCGFFLSLAGSLRGAHSDVVVEAVSPVAVAELVYDDGVDLEPVPSPS